MSWYLLIKNTANGLWKKLNIEKYTFADLEKTYDTYTGAGFEVDLIEGLK